MYDVTIARDPSPNTVIRRDQGLVWHPYTPLRCPPPYEVMGAAGVSLALRAHDGTRYDVIDGMSSWWSVIHGYGHPTLDAAITDQLGRFSHVMFGGLTHEPAVRLAEQLVGLTPEPLQHVFFADSGSVAVEVALKLARQYQSASGRPERRRFAALRGGYHGDTTGAMGVTDPIDGQSDVFSGMSADALFLPRPPAAYLSGRELVSEERALGQWVSEVTHMLERERRDLAGVIVEPVLQGAGGMFVYAPECVRALRRLTEALDLVLIFDEIATGFGRTGRLFAAEWAGVSPDIMCVGKALTGGYLSLAAMLCTTEVAERLSRDVPRPLLHGPTFMANPLACAVANTSLELLTADWEPRVRAIEFALGKALRAARRLNAVREVRVIGGVAAIELNRQVDIPAVTDAALRAGAWLRPFRNLVYTMPPYVCTPDETATIGRAMVSAIAEVHG
jgi:adenosylmethionine-8-amino-7-oxononanoate aminotransferase